jgi:hypothetical protein
MLRPMLAFSSDPHIAERQMEALIFSLTTFGYIDGDYDEAERAIVTLTVMRLVEHRVDTGVPDATPEMRRALIERFSNHFREKLDLIEAHVRELWSEVLAEDEDRDTFVHTKLKQRCFELFAAFDGENQRALLDSVDELIRADGQLHPAEVQFRDELAALLAESAEAERAPVTASVPLAKLLPAARPQPSSHDHELFDGIEVHYAFDPDELVEQVAEDMVLVESAISLIHAQREAGEGKLSGKKSAAELAEGSRFLDRWTHVLVPERGRSYELTVLGDLHGCYSCLKAAVMQTRFFERLAAFQADPEHAPDPKLVFLGDYIDRGNFSLNGVLRAVLRLVNAEPEHVYALRGNHEFYVEHKGQIYGGVKPAEAIDGLKRRVSVEVFRAYKMLFDMLPSSLIFDRTLFVHGGIPRDRMLKEKWKDLSSLNDAEVRFQMMWSDPSTASVIPAALQGTSARFPFGRQQLASFLARIGCHTLVRGHEKIDEGFRCVYDDPSARLISLFSAGGALNADLPESSSYREVDPMGMTLRHAADGSETIEPFEIDWESYNDPERNAFFREPEGIDVDDDGELEVEVD